MAVRRTEDRRACNLLRADYVHLQTLIDCVYRSNPQSGEPLYPMQSDVFGPIHPIDLDVALPHLSNLLSTLPPARHYVAPIGVGNHIDHQLLRLGVKRAALGPVVFYEEFPYCINSEPLDPPPGLAEVHSVSNLALEQKIRAVRAYESQIRPLFSAESNMVSVISAYVHGIGGERLWHPIGERNG